MNKLIAATVLIVGTAAFAFASAVPEIDAGSAGSALSLLAAAVLVIRGRRR